MKQFAGGAGPHVGPGGHTGPPLRTSIVLERGTYWSATVDTFFNDVWYFRIALNSDSAIFCR